MKTKLRDFGLIWSLVFAVIAFFPYLKHSPIRVWAIYPALGFLITSFLYPQIYQTTRFYSGWLKFGGIIGKINSKIIIFILFYFIFLPIGLVLKLLKKDLLNKKLDKSSQSYFITRQEPLSDMKNQF